MAIQSGAHLGPYEIISAIGAGGMGEVYRARDLKLGRDVAIKVLPALFVREPERLSRSALAALNDPDIASISSIKLASRSTCKSFQFPRPKPPVQWWR